jgi:hypothetical protein
VASVQTEIDKLKKYVAGKDLAVAIHLTRRAHFDPAKLVIPKLNIPRQRRSCRACWPCQSRYPRSGMYL